MRLTNYELILLISYSFLCGAVSGAIVYWMGRCGLIERIAGWFL